MYGIEAHFVFNKGKVEADCGIIYTFEFYKRPRDNVIKYPFFRVHRRIGINTDVRATKRVLLSFPRML